jgi:mono/diheme cytochrome c family protein
MRTPVIPSGGEKRRRRLPPGAPARRGIFGIPAKRLRGLALGTVFLAACTERTAPRNATASESGTVVAATTFASYGAGAAAGGPGVGKRYAFGRTPTRAEVAAWKTEVGPDGRELPPGRGTVAQGAALYQTKCAMCHNRNGEGMAPVYPALIGRDPKAEGFHFASDPKLVKTIGNYWPHATTVFDYVRRAMPYNAPGSLSDDQVYALTAFLLAANKVIPADAALDARALRKVKVPYADRFVPDDRHGGPEVR